MPGVRQVNPDLVLAPRQRLDLDAGERPAVLLERPDGLHGRHGRRAVVPHRILDRDRARIVATERRVDPVLALQRPLDHREALRWPCMNRRPSSRAASA
ncbi:MAG: hypothetical protein R2752_19135 [Vicinamibacterales bacterium]